MKLVTIKILTKSAALLIALAIGAGHAHAEFYKWVDENGDVQFGDKVPTEDSQRGHDILNKQGIVVDTIDPPKTEEELRQIREQERLAELKRREAEKQAARDKALLKSFTSIDELINAHNERMTLIDQSIFVSKGRIRKQQVELTKLEKRRQSFIRQGMDVPEWVEENEFLVLEKIAIIEEYIRIRQDEKITFEAGFEKDYNRYKEITQRAFSSR